MSGSSWFDLSSIQDQINKSLHEAAKIAEDASRYDILNFDAMAEEEEKEVESEDEGDTETKAAPIQQIHHIPHIPHVTSSGVKHDHQVKGTTHESQHSTQSAVLQKFSSETNTEGSPMRVDKARVKSVYDSDNETATATPYTASTLNAGNNINTAVKRGKEEKEKDEWDDDGEEEEGGFLGSPPVPVGSLSECLYTNHADDTQGDGLNAHRKSLFPATNASTAAAHTPAPYSAPSSSSGDNRDREREREREADRSNRNSSRLTNTAVDMPSPSPSDPHSDSNTTPLKPFSSSSGDVQDGPHVHDADLPYVQDDFFGDQFKGIHTVKKDKPVRSYPNEEMKGSIDRDEGDRERGGGDRGEKERERGDRGTHTGAVSTHENIKNMHDVNIKNMHDVNIKSTDERDVPVTVVATNKDKTRKKKKKGGGLDFFGISKDVTTVSPSLSTAGGADPSPEVPSFTFFEPVGMLDEEEGKYGDTYGHTGGEGFSSYGSGSNGGNRMPQRLPGMVISSNADSGMQSLSDVGSAAGKVLFSFFDNVEEEIDSNEDPILRQVAYNKANPHSQSQSNSYSRALNIFGIHFAPSSSSSSGGAGAGGQNEGDIDLETEGRGGNKITATAGVNIERSSLSSLFTLSSLLSLLRIVMETVVVVVKGTIGCVSSACQEEGGRGVGPVGYIGHLNALLRQGGQGGGGGGAGAGGEGGLSPQQLRIVQVRAVLLVVWENTSSVNGISVLTMLLFVLSYFKFARYGTDNGS